MIRIEFTGDDVVKLKNEVREFAITHLGINFEKAAAQIIASTVSVDGHPPTMTTPMNMNSTPVPETTTGHTFTAEEPKKRGRPVGWRKPEPGNQQQDFVTEAATESPAASLQPASTAPAPESMPTLPPVNVATVEEVRNAVNQLIQNNKIDVAREFLARFKATKVSEVKEQDRAPLITLIKETLAKK